jgi:hypothetical protein
VTAAKADAEAAAAEQAVSGVSRHSIAPVESVMVEANGQIGAAAKPAAGGIEPVPPIPEPESERGFATTGEIETPTQITVWENSASASAFGDSPRREQTAKIVTADAMDANIESAVAPSAYMGEYLTADANIAAPSNTAIAPKASESQVAAVQPMAQSMVGEPYAVQLASYRSEAGAMQGWLELRGNAPDLLDPVSTVVQRADLGGDLGTVYRLRTTPTAKTNAASLCAELKTRGIDCLVVKEAPSETRNGSHAG